MSLFLKLVPALIFWVIWILVIFYVPYPESLTQASTWQIFIFFAPLFLAITFTLSVPIALGVVFLLLLKALDALNFVSVALVVAIVVLLTRVKLTSSGKISKLTSLRGRRK